MPWAVLFRPFRANFGWLGLLPKALPWAVLSRPFRALRKCVKLRVGDGNPAQRAGLNKNGFLLEFMPYSDTVQE